MRNYKTKESLKGSKNVYEALLGKKDVYFTLLGAKDVYIYMKSFLEVFVSQSLFEVKIKITPGVDLKKLFKMSFLEAKGLLEINDEVKLVSKKGVKAEGITSVKIEILSLLKRLDIDIDNIINCEFRDSEISLLGEKKIGIGIESDIEINVLKVIHKINTYITMFYDVNGVLNTKAVKKFAIDNNVSLPTLLKLVKEVQNTINALTEISLFSGTTFALNKTIKINSGIEAKISIDLRSKSYALLSIYWEDFLSEMFDETLEELTYVY